MTIEQAKSELMQIYGALSPDKQRAIDTLVKIEPCEDEYIKVPKKALKYRTAGMVAYNAEWLKNHFDIERVAICGAQEPCEDAISRQAVDELSKELVHITRDKADFLCNFWEGLQKLPSVNPQELKIGHCKDCEYFEYDSVARVDGIPLIVAHEICSRWGDGCKTKEGGYCFLFEPQESEE